MVTRKKTVVRQAELGVLAPADHESIVLIKCENASSLRPGHDMQCYTHLQPLYGKDAKPENGAKASEE
jgi:hypothetical protein